MCVARVGASARPLSLHASLGLVVNMRDEHNNMCNIYVHGAAVAHGLGFTTLSKTPRQPAQRRGGRHGLGRLPPRPVLVNPELA